MAIKAGRLVYIVSRIAKATSNNNTKQLQQIRKQL